MQRTYQSKKKQNNYLFINFYIVLINRMNSNYKFIPIPYMNRKLFEN